MLYTPQEAYAVFEGTRSPISYYSNGNNGYGHYNWKCSKTDNPGKNDIDGKFNPKYCNAYRCNTGTIKFDPFGSNDDLDWKLDNPTCIGFISTVGAAMVTADFAMKFLCKPTNSIGLTRWADEEAIDNAPPPPLPIITPSLLTRVARKTSQCGSRIGESSSLSASCAAVPPPGNAAFCTNAGLAASDVTRCCGGLAAFTATIGAAVAALSIIWDVARITYENARICGHDWQQWEENEEGIMVKTKGPYRRCIEALFLEDTVPSYCSLYKSYSGFSEYSSISMTDSKASDLNIENQFYREFIYGGKEFIDNPTSEDTEACTVPTGWSNEKRKEALGYISNAQRYYMTGPGSAAVYACQRFLSSSPDDEDAIRAFECCKSRSQNTICIENRPGLGDTLVEPYNHGFCSLTSRCNAGNVTFEAFESKTQPNYICAKTYSVCPYDHLVGGGTEETRYNSATSREVDNYCQVMNHCVKRPILPYVRTSTLDGAFISSACRDLKGDSQNSYGYEAGILPIKVDKFSAPMAQCFKETMENIFLHKAGDTKCLNPDEAPNEDGECVSGYTYKKGETLEGKSFFVKVQDKLQGAVKMALSIAIMFLGFVILRGVPNAAINKKLILTYILKIGLVMYFAVGDAWQGWFMKGLVDSSVFLSELTFRPDEDGDPSKLDGCQFPRYNYADSDPGTKYDNPAYPPGKGYLKIWDTLDCKISRALGFGPEVSVPNIIMMIVAGFFTGGVGLVFVVGAFFFAFFLIALTIRALHIFLLSITSIVILIYVSPIMITLAMFEKTKDIFNNWMKQLLGFSLQPLILFAYLGIMLSIFDSVVIGQDVTFEGSSDDPYGRESPKRIECNSAADVTSIYCIFRVADIKTNAGLEVIGVGIPFLTSINQEKIETILKAAIIMFIFSKFMDQIAGFASNLVGGATLQSDWNVSASGMAKKTYGAMRAIQQRGMRAIKKHGGKVARGAAGAAKGLGDLMTDEGKSTAVKRLPGGSDSTASSTGSNASASSTSSDASGSSVGSDATGGSGALRPSGSGGASSGGSSGQGSDSTASSGGSSGSGSSRSGDGNTRRT